MRLSLVVFITFIVLHRPPGKDGDAVFINPRHVVAVNSPRDHGHFSVRVHCLVQTDAGHQIQVIETCEEVKDLLKDN